MFTEYPLQKGHYTLIACDTHCAPLTLWFTEDKAANITRVTPDRITPKRNLDKIRCPVRIFKQNPCPCCLRMDNKGVINQQARAARP